MKGREWILDVDLDYFGEADRRHGRAQTTVDGSKGKGKRVRNRQATEALTGRRERRSEEDGQEEIEIGTKRRPSLNPPSNTRRQP